MTEIVGKRKPLTPIIKAVGNFCNLRCSYCFYSRQDQSNQTVMSRQMLESFLSQFFQLFAGPARFIWHGGEPLLAGVQFYQCAVDLQRKYCLRNQPVENFIQTNATLINDRWARFFYENQFHVGVSIDGDILAHDSFRVDSRGTGSFLRVCSGLERLRSRGVPFGVVMVLNDRNANRMREIFQFLTQQIGAKNISINTFTDEAGYSQAGSAALKRGQFVKAIMDCIEQWPAEENGTLRLRELDGFVAGALGKRSRACSFNGGCRNYFCVNYDGAVYPCDDFAGHPDMKLGDLTRESLVSILDGPARASIMHRFEAIHPECAGCQWYQACHNGCPGQRVGGIEGRYALCEDRKELFTYVKRSVDAYTCGA